VFKVTVASPFGCEHGRHRSCDSRCFSPRIAEPIDEKSPTGLARGMSQAVAKVSGLLLGDIFKVVRAASEKEGK